MGRKIDRRAETVCDDRGDVSGQRHGITKTTHLEDDKLAPGSHATERIRASALFPSDRTSRKDPSSERDVKPTLVPGPRALCDDDCDDGREEKNAYGVTPVPTKPRPGPPSHATETFRERLGAREIGRQGVHSVIGRESFLVWSSCTPGGRQTYNPTRIMASSRTRLSS